MKESGAQAVHLYEGVPVSDLPSTRMFHLYEGVRSSDRSTYMKGSGAQTCPGGCSTYMKGPELRPGCRAQTCPGGCSTLKGSGAQIVPPI